MITDSRLVGQWQTPGKLTTLTPHLWNFDDRGQQSLQADLGWTEKDNKQGQFSAHLFKLKQEMFLDIIPSECNFATNQADLVGISIIPGHLLARVGLGPELKMAFFDFDWLKKYLEQNPKALAHHKEDDNIVLTAETRDLQQFVLKHLGTNELFGQMGVLTRQTNSPP